MMLRFVCIVLVFFLRTACAFGQNDDGFNTARKIEGEHFTIYYQSGVKPGDLIDQLSISHTDEILSGQMVNASSDNLKLSSMVDVLYARASDILDMHVYSYKGSIKIFATLKELTDFYTKIFHAPVPGTGYAFYLDDFKSIYISAEYFRRDALGHEIGHAITGAYFVVQPSVKIQEVLAGYIDYQLKKSE